MALHFSPEMLHLPYKRPLTSQASGPLHAQERVRADLKQWLSWLRQEVGFQGLRLDFSKGYAGQWVKVSRHPSCRRAVVNGRHTPHLHCTGHKFGNAAPVFHA